MNDKLVILSIADLKALLDYLSEEIRRAEDSREEEFEAGNYDISKEHSNNIASFRKLQSDIWDELDSRIEILKKES